MEESFSLTFATATEKPRCPHKESPDFEKIKSLSAESSLSIEGEVVARKAGTEIKNPTGEIEVFAALRSIHKMSSSSFRNQRHPSR
jgi:aspartyl-tRNA synthetase